MIVRLWRGRAAATQATAYPAHFHATVLPELRGIAGFLGASLLRTSNAEGSDGGEGIEFLVMTRWESMDAIRVFAGDDAEHAVVEPGAVAALVDFDVRVRHYEVVEEA